MSKIILSIFLTLTFSQFSSAQTRFMDHKFYVDVNVAGYYPWVSCFIRNQEVYVPNENSFSRRKDRFESGIRLGATYVSRPNFGIGLEFSQEFNNVSIKHTFGYYDNGMLKNYFALVEKLKIRTSIITLRLDFKNTDGSIPVGLNHHIGVGLALSRPVGSDYMVFSYDYVPFKPNDMLSNFDSPIKSVNLFYGVSYRLPITENLMWNLNLRYNLNIFTENSFFFFDDNYEEFPSLLDYKLNRNVLQDEIRRRRNVNFINLGTGFIYSF
jgi:hypothetical protein